MVVYYCFSRIQKLLGRTETLTRDRMYLGRIRSVRDISRDDRARIATCSLRTPTDRLVENYSIDVVPRVLDTFQVIQLICTFFYFGDDTTTTFSDRRCIVTMLPARRRSDTFVVGIIQVL